MTVAVFSRPVHGVFLMKSVDVSTGTSEASKGLKSLESFGQVSTSKTR